MTPTDAAIAFEAVKIAWRQSKDGFVLTLSIHPDDVQSDLANSRIGTRYQIAMVQLSDDNQPVAGPATAEAAKALRVAVMLCRDPRFWEWIAVAHGVFVENEEEATEWLRDELNIETRSLIKSDPDVRNRFEQLRDTFQKSFKR